MTQTCAFCSVVPSRPVLVSNFVYAMFSYWPVSPYHFLIVPRRHIEDEKDLTLEEIIDVFCVKKRLIEVIGEKTGFRSYNFGLNAGREAGQTVDHLHYHVIFRRKGDTIDPTGGIRNVIPNKGRYGPNSVNKQEKEVESWTEEIRAVIE